MCNKKVSVFQLGKEVKEIVGLIQYVDEFHNDYIVRAANSLDEILIAHYDSLGWEVRVTDRSIVEEIVQYPKCEWLNQLLPFVNRHIAELN